MFRHIKDSLRSVIGLNAPTAPTLEDFRGSLSDVYERLRVKRSDMNEHMDLLYHYASTCAHVTEFGTNVGVSAVAFLHAHPETFITYDRQRWPHVDLLQEHARECGVTFHFRQEDTRSADIALTDFLFIDTLHTDAQMRQELQRHAGNVQKYIGFHDTVRFATCRNEPGTPGIWPAIAEYLRAHPEWRIVAHREQNNGLTIITRVCSSGHCRRGPA